MELVTLHRYSTRKKKSTIQSYHKRGVPVYWAGLGMSGCVGGGGGAGCLQVLAQCGAGIVVIEVPTKKPEDVRWGERKYESESDCMEGASISFPPDSLTQSQNGECVVD